MKTAETADESYLLLAGIQPVLAAAGIEDAQPVAVSQLERVKLMLEHSKSPNRRGFYYEHDCKVNDIRQVADYFGKETRMEVGKSIFPGMFYLSLFIKDTVILFSEDFPA